MILYTPTPVKAGQLAGDVFLFSCFLLVFLCDGLFAWDGILVGIDWISFGVGSLTEGIRAAK